jgi:hypothetical protein
MYIATINDYHIAYLLATYNLSIPDIRLHPYQPLTSNKNFTNGFWSCVTQDWTCVINSLARHFYKKMSCITLSQIKWLSWHGIHITLHVTPWNLWHGISIPSQTKTMFVDNITSLYNYMPHQFPLQLGWWNDMGLTIHN